MANRRQLGVYGANLPTKKSRSVVASDFLIGGILGKFERAFDKAFVVNSVQEKQEIFGLHNDAAKYGSDAVEGFFANVPGVQAKLYIVSHVGYTGTAIDGVTASQQLNDQQPAPAPVLKLEDAYKGELGYGISGNRTGVTVTNGTRYTTAIGVASLSTDTFIYVTAPAGIKVGDIIKVVATGGGGGTVYKKVTAVDEGLKKISFATAFHATATPAQNDVVTVLGFRLRLWRKSTTGVVSEVDTERGKVYCTTEPEAVDFYAPNVFADSPWVKVSRLATTPADIEDTFPADVATVTYPTNGAAGTAPTTASHWSRALTRFNDLPVRIIANPESTVQAVQQAIETYCKGRADNPTALFNGPELQSKVQLQAIGQAYQRSDDVLGIYLANWLEVSDPFNTGSLAPVRHVPIVGHAMGAWIRGIATKGAHYIPCTRDIPILGALGVVGDQFLSDVDRTELSNAGVNVVQEVAGVGILLRNFFTPSTADEFAFGNALLLRAYIKVSAVDSLQISENTPNSLNRVKEDRMAVLFFMRRLWDVGSNGNVPVGETFGQSIHEDGSETTFEEHVEVRADLVNNPQDRLNLGERNIDVYFTYPAPAGSIKIGVGILLRS